MSRLRQVIGLGADACSAYSARHPNGEERTSKVYMKPSTLRNLLFAICILIAALLLICVSWNTAASQALATPTPDGMLCITPTPTGDQWCMIPPVAVTVTPSATPVPPTVPAVTPAGELTPFEPTATPTVTPMPTNTPSPTASAIVISPLPKPKAYLPIVRMP